MKDYVTNLKVHSKTPKALRFDRGTEFVNESLLSWLREQGIEVQMTAGYSPAQNGAAERLNRTLVELGRAMMIARDVPNYLWKYALQHAAYIHEWAPTKALPGTTPYEAWNGIKPNVAHLWEFATPVYMLVQGQNRPKLLPKSKPHLFLGYDDGSLSVKYYIAKTRKVHTLRNYKFLTNLSLRETPPEPLFVDPLPALLREGECASTTQQTGMQQTGSQTLNKWQHEEPCEDVINQQEPLQRRLRTKAPVNYRYLNDPFPDEEEDDTTHLSYATTIYHAILGSDDPQMVGEAKTFDDWPEWEKAIKTELDQLKHCGTWKLVDCPNEAVPIPNKWVFVKKYNNQGELLKYKARLVVKGCAQRPGFDYNDTFSPVVRLETIRAILSMVPSKKLQIQQMDVKGAYLNANPMVSAMALLGYVCYKRHCMD